MNNTHKVNKTLEKIDYQKHFLNSGHEVEVISFYKVDPMMITNPPNHSDKIQEVIKLLEGTGISKLSITHLDRNLSERE